MTKQFCVEHPRDVFTIYNRDFTLDRIVQRVGDGGDYYRSGAFYTVLSLGEFDAARAEFAARPRLACTPAEPDRIIALPFAGFYESIWSGLVDGEFDQWCEYEVEREESREYHPDTFQPEPLRISASEYADLLIDHSDCSNAYRDIARDYVSTFADMVSEDLAEVIPGFTLGLRYESVSSPRFYNFETDRLFAYIPFSVVQRLFAYSQAHHHAALVHVLRRRHTSRSGFSSHYSNDLATWLAKPLVDWDHNELQSLLLACMAQAAQETPYYRSTSEGIDWRVFDHGDFGSYGHEYFETAIDWPALERARDELREEKRQDAIAAGELEADDCPQPRCPHTLELFA